ncbi:MAG: acyl-CoA thioesterase [Panacagrimonas sp.]
MKPPEPFRYFLRVRYGECDAQKVVFNARYGDYMDAASAEFIRALGFGAQMVDGRLDYQLVKQSIEWASPAQFDEVLAIAVQAGRIGNTSFSLTFDFASADGGRHIAASETIYVVVDASLNKQPVPDDFRQALEQGARGACVDHAGWFANDRRS